MNYIDSSNQNNYFNNGPKIRDGVFYKRGVFSFANRIIILIYYIAKCHFGPIGFGVENY